MNVVQCNSPLSPYPVTRFLSYICRETENKSCCYFIFSCFVFLIYFPVKVKYNHSFTLNILLREYHTHSDVQHCSVSVISSHRSTTWIGTWGVWSVRSAERLCANTTAATLKTKKSTANWIISGNRFRLLFADYFILDYFIFDLTIFVSKYSVIDLLHRIILK